MTDVFVGFESYRGLHPSKMTPKNKKRKDFNLNLAEAEVAKHYNFVKSLSVEAMESYKQA